MTAALTIVTYAVLLLASVILISVAVAVVVTALLPLGAAFKALETWLADRRTVARRLNAPIRGNALVAWRRR